MSEVTGVVESIGTKEVKTRFGMKPTFSMKVDGEWYKLGFTKPKCDKGDEVTFSYTEGTYGREVDAKAISVGAGGVKGAPTPAAARPAPSYGGKGVFPIPALDGQRAIVRQNALTNAREAVVAAFGGGVFVPDAALADNIISLARKFEAYACGDLDAVRASELKAGLAKRGPTAEEVMEDA